MKVRVIEMRELYQLMKLAAEGDKECAKHLSDIADDPDYNVYIKVVLQGKKQGSFKRRQIIIDNKKIDFSVNGIKDFLYLIAYGVVIFFVVAGAICIVN